MFSSSILFFLVFEFPKKHWLLACAIDTRPQSERKTVVVRPSFDHPLWRRSHACRARLEAFFDDCACVVCVELQVLSLSLSGGVYLSTFEGVAGILAKF